MFLRYKQKSEAGRNSYPAKTDSAPIEFSANLGSEEKLNAEHEALKEEVVRLTDEEIILTNRLEVLSLSQSEKHNDLKMRLNNAQSELLELQPYELDDASAVPSNAGDFSAADSLEPCVDSDELQN